MCDVEWCDGDDMQQFIVWFDLMMLIEMVKVVCEQDGLFDWLVICWLDVGFFELLFIQLVGYYGWSWYGDYFDQQEEVMLYFGMEFCVVFMLYGIYFFEGLYMDSWIGKWVDLIVKWMIDKFLYQFDFEQDIRFEWIKVVDYFVCMMGFSGVVQVL